MEKLLDYLVKHNLLWSYDPQQVQFLPENIIIEQTLRYGDVPQLRLLFETIDIKIIQKVWEQHLLPQPQYKKMNYYLAKLYFKKRGNIHQYIDYFIQNETRLNKLQRLIAENSGLAT
jgi:hypothetical protein